MDIIDGIIVIFILLCAGIGLSCILFKLGILLEEFLMEERRKDE